MLVIRQPNIGAKHTDSEKQEGQGSNPLCLLMGEIGKFLPSLCLSFLSYKMEIVRVPTSLLLEGEMT